MKRSVVALLVLLAGTALAVPARGGKLKIQSTTFGWDPFTQSVPSQGTTPESKFPAVAVNQPVLVEFDENIKKSSVDATTVYILSISAEELAPDGLTSSIPGGVQAPVTLKVKKNRIEILPAMLFVGNSVSFGFAPNAYYRLFLVGKKKGIRGTNGDKLPQTVTIDFRTTSQVADPKPGTPEGKVFLVDSEHGKVKLQKSDPESPKVSFKDAVPNPTPALRIDFDETVLPSTVVNPATKASPSILVQLDVDDNLLTTTDRIIVPGEFTLEHKKFKSTVHFQSTLQSIPPARTYVVTILPTVEDILGNSVFSQTGDIGLIDVFAFRTRDTGPLDLPPIVENFNGVVNRDEEATSADWAQSLAGVLRPGAGGGTGVDGPFEPTADTALATSVFDPDLGQDVPRVWNFTRVTIPSGVTVRADGPFPLLIRATGEVTVLGTIDVSGEDGEQFDSNRIEPGAGGAANAGGGAGGRGGSVTDGVDLDVALFQNGVPGYAPPDRVNQGLSGRSNLVEDFLLRSESGAASFLGLDGLWIQPNVGTGSSDPNATPGDQVFHNHPTFRIESVTSAAILNVVSDPNDPDYFGPLTQPGLDLYELPPPPIAKPFDPIQVGDLAGHEGEDVLPGGGGGRSLPLTVAQSFLTTVRSGGGGGGGGRSAGTPGEDSPTGGQFGESTGTEGGTAGVGASTGTVLGETETTLTVQGTPFDSLGLPGPGQQSAGGIEYVVFPNVDEGAAFRILSADTSSGDTVLAIEPVEVLIPTGADVDQDGDVDLSDVPDGSTCRVEPSFDFGGSGGGGSGVHLAGTTKLTGPPNLTLPVWTPGAGGGAGGGVVSIESAKRVTIAASGTVLARGGDGGRSVGVVGESASGGGGGGGGTIRLASAMSGASPVRVDGVVSAVGGVGGAGLVDGGDGGDGRVRFESLTDSLDPDDFAPPNVEPAPAATDFFYLLPGQAETVGQSKFIWTKSLFAFYDGFTVTYNAVVDGIPQTGLTYTYQDFLQGVEAPFEITFNDADITGGGTIDPNSIDDVFVEDIATLTGPFVRFRIILQPKVTIDGTEYRNIEIDRLQIDISG